MKSGCETMQKSIGHKDCRSGALAELQNPPVPGVVE